MAAYAFYILYTIAPYIKVHKLDNKINKKTTCILATCTDVILDI